MKLAFCLLKYFPFGGQQRDFLRIAKACLERGHRVDVYTSSWVGDKPAGFNVMSLKLKGYTNHTRRESLAMKLKQHVDTGDYHAVIGFIKMPDLDIYYTADSCFATKVSEKSFLYRLTKRSRSYLSMEKAVFDPSSKTTILMLSEPEKKKYIHYYKTPEHRIHMLPPGISKDRLAPENPNEILKELRQELFIDLHKKIVLIVGSGFKTKGVDRAIYAVSSLPAKLLKNTVLLIVGNDRSKPFQQLSCKLGIEKHVRFLGGRDDIPRFLIASDLLLHPAYRENTGTVLIEAMASRLPVLATDVCGYSHHVEKAEAGEILPSPFSQEALNKKLEYMLTSDLHDQWCQNGGKYISQTDVFSLVEKAVEIIEKVAAC